MSGIVLQKALASLGIASRRKAEELIINSKVKVNGKIENKLGTRVLPKDKIEVAGFNIDRPEKLVYFLLNKPKGYLSSAKNERDRKSIVSLIACKQKIVPVGRLDVGTTGLIFLSNDGDFVYKLTHPKFEKEKEYHALVRKNSKWSVDKLEKSLEKIEKGITVATGFKTSPSKCGIIKKDSVDDNLFIAYLIIHEGKKHQIKQMLAAVGLTVLELSRVRVGNVKVGKLKIGQYRELTKKEVENLKNI